MTKKRRIIFMSLGLGIGIVALVTISGLGSKLLARLHSKNLPESAVQQQLSLKKAAETVSAVEKLMELPDEEPTVATVSDLATLQGQPFFADAEEGDRVLFYTQAKKAILYRPTSNKIIEVAALSIPQ